MRASAEGRRPMFFACFGTEPSETSGYFFLPAACFAATAFCFFCWLLVALVFFCVACLFAALGDLSPIVFVFRLTV